LPGYTAVIGNAKCYGGFFYVTPHASVTDDHLDICVFKGKTRANLLRFIIGVLRQKHLDFKDVDYVKASHMQIQSDSRVHVQIDGEYFGTLPVTIEVVRDAINVVW
jgi:diacylglycerol kinase (ATP)